MGKPRGRKLLKKKQHEDEELVPSGSIYNDDQNNDLKANDTVNNGEPNTFYGVLDTQELEYFKQAESTLAIDTFETPEEKEQFISSVIEESKNKELKLACNIPDLLEADGENYSSRHQSTIKGHVPELQWVFLQLGVPQIFIACS